MASRIRSGDLVVVISGKHKGATGKVAAVVEGGEGVLIEGVNLVRRRTRATTGEQATQQVEREAPVRACKVMPVDPSTGKATRVRWKLGEDGERHRIAAKSGAALAGSTEVAKR